VINTEDFEIVEYDIPDDLPDYALQIEWVNEAGAETTYNKLKPSVVLFNGITSYDKKESYTLPSDIYNYDATISSGLNSLSSYSKNMNLSLAYYWRLLGFNVGIFHYENFADDDQASLTNKAYSKQAMRYVNVDGTLVEENLPEYTLTEAFVMAWLKFANNAVEGTSPPNKVMELRLIGHLGGANIAVAAGEYLYNLARDGHISRTATPSRITLIRPYLDNAKINLNVDYKSDTLIDSVLSYNSQIIKDLSDRGVTFEIVEDDPEFFYRYKEPYTGLVDIEIDYELVEATPETTKTIGVTGDSEKYSIILKSSASLYLRETYSTTYYTDEYKALERSALDWYLYSAMGTDNTTITGSTTYDFARGYDKSSPQFDDYRESYSTTYVRYALSAWTPTTYMSAMRGVSYECIAKNSTNSDGQWVGTPYTMSQFQSEAFQVSNKKGVYLCGFVFISRDGTKYMNFSEDSRVRDVTIKVVLVLDGAGSGSATVEREVKTDSRGFWELELSEQYMGGSCTLTLIPPYGASVTQVDSSTSLRKYEELSFASFDDQEKSVSITTNTWRFQYLFFNACLVA
jgi:hypothetical protein